MGDEHAQATVAFWKYMGYYCQPDQEEGKRIFAKLTTPEGLRWKNSIRHVSRITPVMKGRHDNFVRNYWKYSPKRQNACPHIRCHRR